MVRPYQHLMHSPLPRAIKVFLLLLASAVALAIPLFVYLSLMGNSNPPLILALMAVTGNWLVVLALLTGLTLVLFDNRHRIRQLRRTNNNRFKV